MSRSVVLGVWILGACGPAGPPEPVATADTAVAGVHLSGRLTDPGGGPLAQVVLQACSAVCVAASTDADGGFGFAGLAPGAWSLKVSASGAGHSSAVIPLALVDDRVVAITVPWLAEEVVVPVGGGDLTVAEGLILSVHPTNLPGIDAIAAGPIPAGSWPPLDGIDVDPIAGFYLTPLGAGLDVPFTIDAAGTRAWCTDPEGLGWVGCDTAIVSGGVSGQLPDFGTVIVGR